MGRASEGPLSAHRDPTLARGNDGRTFRASWKAGLGRTRRAPSSQGDLPRSPCGKKPRPVDCDNATFVRCRAFELS